MAFDSPECGRPRPATAFDPEPPVHLGLHAGEVRSLNLEDILNSLLRTIPTSRP